MNNAIEVQGLCKNYPGFSLKNVSFAVPEGLCCGFVGPNGALRNHYFENYGRAGCT